MQYRDLSENLSFGGQPNADELRELARKGVRTIVNVRAPDEEEANLPPAQEQALAESLGMTYVNVPLTAKTIAEDTAAQVKRAIADAKNTGPVFVH
ncbi:MAG: hypothetical protein A3J27_04420 [Candidatus Tectomicrobia bacterium RIFCSPLOWO2_12_FULL_69_37]|nr:MAG: hypothetical protein A3I72_08935 [Candidatus Tectomicrobia bacterium RIFCSPLOWO2_02_FULL_70_19]OGL59185.1 MAG: hypothetical protein A3J27_04420 [Candidatus Tectomicrobia bacterium RIFCSPLOWO2_12_FULL_69_37]